MAVVEVTWEDDFADGAIILILKQFRNPKTVYQYAAIKIKGLWFITGNHYNGSTSGLYPAQLLDWLLKGMDPQHPPRIFWAPEVIELD